MANGWTSERRARQAALIQRWKPWERSTGPTCARGPVTALLLAYDWFGDRFFEARGCLGGKPTGRCL